MEQIEAFTEIAKTLGWEVELIVDRKYIDTTVFGSVSRTFITGDLTMKLDMHRGGVAVSTAPLPIQEALDLGMKTLLGE